jgi:hypothetical protein
MPQLKLRPPKVLFKARASGFTGVHMTDFVAPACSRLGMTTQIRTFSILVGAVVFGGPAVRAWNGVESAVQSAGIVLLFEKPRR